jgi:hypothetical protein
MLQWIDLNNFEVHLIYTAAEFRGQCLDLKSELQNIESSRLIGSTLKTAEIGVNYGNCD